MNYSDKSVLHKYLGKPPNGKSSKFESYKGGNHIDAKLTSEKLKKNNKNNIKNEISHNKSETDHYVSVGGTLSDGLKSMKMVPILNLYQEIDNTNRSYFWKLYLEGLGGKNVIIDKQEDDPENYFEKNKDQTVIRKIEICTLINNDAELYWTKLDLENQSVISLDIDRTRNSIKHLKTKAEKMLTLFWKSHNIKYKQGMNEIISLFLLSQESNRVEDYECYNIFTRFMHIFLPTFYNDVDFLSLQWSLGLFELLLKYHDPEVALYLQRWKVSCDIYAFNWFMTLFASKLPLHLSYLLWDFIIQEGDWMMIFYISIAFFIFHRQEILMAEEFIIPQTITNLSLK